MNKSKCLYFTVFILVAFAFVFHVTAMGFHHWKEAKSKNFAAANVIDLSFGLFTRCAVTNGSRGQVCEPNLFSNLQCVRFDCASRTDNDTCSCDYLPSSKGIAACAIIASIFLGLALILLFLQSINESNESRLIAIFFGFLPWFLLLFTWIFILITLILVGGYLSRDVMFLLRLPQDQDEDLSVLRQRAEELYDIRIGWSAGLDIIALVLTFFSFVLYGVFVFRVGR